ncbi:MAG: carbohydrate kinase family protein [Clostridia bacterium]|nr:carbohydrate kinase family protein [Clostridia bacterium]
MSGKVIAAGHICLDITPVFPKGRTCAGPEDILVPGKLIAMDQADVHTGGSVANTGLALKLLGNDVTLLGKVGEDDFGRMIAQILYRYGAGGLITAPGTSTSYSVVLALPDIDRIFLHHPGANDTFSAEDVPDSALDDADLFHFGYPPIMRKMYENDGEELAALFRRVKARGIATSLDLAAVDAGSDAGKADWKAILQKVLPDVDFFLPSFEELCFMLKPEKYRALNAQGGDMTERLDPARDVAPLLDEVIGYGCGVAVIKCGKAGMAWKTADEASLCRVGERLRLDSAAWADRGGFQPCFRADTVLSATGAGDTSIAAFLTAVLQKRGPEECVALAAAEGACAVTSYDALGGLKSLTELEERIRNGWKTIPGGTNPVE